MTLSGYFRSITIAAAVAASVLPADAEAKYVFYFIGDGMGMGHVNTAETYNRDVLHADKLVVDKAALQKIQEGFA